MDIDPRHRPFPWLYVGLLNFNMIGAGAASFAANYRLQHYDHLYVVLWLLLGGATLIFFNGVAAGVWWLSNWYRRRCWIRSQTSR